MTLVTLGLPVFNGAAYLREALESAVQQTYSELEIVISDNGSTDGTESICREFAAADPRIRYIRHDVNRGASYNHNFVIHEARGAYFRWYSYDDRMAPTCVEECAKVLDDRPDVILAWPQTRVIDETGQVVSEYRTDLPWESATPSGRLQLLLGRPTEESLLHMCYPIYGLMRTQVLRTTGLLRPLNAADDILLVELALRGKWEQVPQRLFYNRRHPESSVPGRPPEEIAQWFDPNRRAVFPLPRTGLLAGYLRAVWEGPLSARERVRCLREVGAWVARSRRWRVIAGELRLRSAQEIRFRVHALAKR